ncbi:MULTISPECIES: hypothetical protein [unclassified Synechococcus]|uniref:hypothetical protein n=1 Tax=unclassified Synechococcus TaxID=2626047 RepID=UPI001C23392C|nr:MULTISPECIES: hypothetical protein [unclassified Synechococcus]
MDSRSNTGSAAKGSTQKKLSAAERRERLQALQQGDDGELNSQNMSSPLIAQTQGGTAQ